jgi:hypothetical protein
MKLPVTKVIANHLTLFFPDLLTLGPSKLESLHVANKPDLKSGAHQSNDIFSALC